MMSKRGKIDILSVFLVATIVLSIITTFIVLNHINAMITGWPTYTPTSAGQINVSIDSNLTILLTNYNMSFGTGYVVNDKVHATINSSSVVTTAILQGANWTNTSAFSPQRFILRNDGNVNATITFTSSATAAQMIGGTNPDFKYNSSAKDTNACKGNLVDWISVTGASQNICANGGLSPTDTKDEIYVDVLLQIPYDVVGTKEAFFVFSATAAPGNP